MQVQTATFQKTGMTKWQHKQQHGHKPPQETDCLMGGVNEAAGYNVFKDIDSFV
jgi:predicted phage gp36 major capsid-like protein